MKPCSFTAATCYQTHTLCSTFCSVCACASVFHSSQGVSGNRNHASASRFLCVMPVTGLWPGDALFIRILVAQSEIWSLSLSSSRPPDASAPDVFLLSVSVRDRKTALIMRADNKSAVTWLKLASSAEHRLHNWSPSVLVSDSFQQFSQCVRNPWQRMFFLMQHRARTARRNSHTETVRKPVGTTNIAFYYKWLVVAKFGASFHRRRFDSDS